MEDPPLGRGIFLSVQFGLDTQLSIFLWFGLSVSGFLPWFWLYSTKAR
jgi:hypothetical protein